MASLTRQESITSQLGMDGRIDPTSHMDYDTHYKELSSMYVSKYLPSIFCFIKDKGAFRAILERIPNPFRRSAEDDEKPYCNYDKLNVNSEHLNFLLTRRLFSDDHYQLWEHMGFSNLRRNPIIRTAFRNPGWNTMNNENFRSVTIQHWYNEVFDYAPRPTDEMVMYRCWGSLTFDDMVHNGNGPFYLNGETSVTALHSYASLTWCETGAKKSTGRSNTYPKTPNDKNNTTLIRIRRGSRGVINLSLPSEEANPDANALSRRNGASEVARLKKSQFEVVLDPRGALYPTYRKVEPESLSTVDDNRVYYDEFLYEPVPFLSYNTVYNSAIFEATDIAFGTEIGNTLSYRGNYTEAVFWKFGRATFENKDGVMVEGYINAKGFTKNDGYVWYVELDDNQEVQFPEERLRIFKDYEWNEEAHGFFKKPEKVYDENMFHGLDERRSILYTKIRGKAYYFANLRKNGVLVKATGEVLVPQRPVTRSYIATMRSNASSIFKGRGTRKRKKDKYEKRKKDKYEKRKKDKYEKRKRINTRR